MNRYLFVVVVLLACFCGTIHAGGLRKNANITRNLQGSQVCNIQILDVQFDGRIDGEEYKCLVDGDWNGYNDGIDDFAYDIDLPANFRSTYDLDIRGGDFYVAIPGGEIENETRVTVPDPSAISVIPGLRRKRRELQGNGVSGTNAVLVVRISTSAGDTVSPSRTALAGSIFGLGSGAISHSMKSQYESCSNGDLSFRPVTGSGVVNGVVDVTINQAIQGRDIFSLTNAMNQAAIDALGSSLNETPRHVMYCVPRGTTFNGSQSWVAFAYVNGVSSYYNDQWCDRLSSQVHEIGHNLGMHHSNENGGEYGDQSGYMGFSYPYRDGPLMCFNAFKHAKLGWYSTQHRIVSGDWTGDIAAFTDAASTSLDVILQVGDVYMQLNRQAGKNSGTRERPNELVLVEGTELRRQSHVLAGLEAGQTFNFNNGKTIEVCEMDFTGSVDRAKVSIFSTGQTSGCRSTFNSCQDNPDVVFVIRGEAVNCAWVASRANYFDVRGQYWAEYSDFCTGNAPTFCQSTCRTCP